MVELRKAERLLCVIDPPGPNEEDLKQLHHDSCTNLSRKRELNQPKKRVIQLKIGKNTVIFSYGFLTKR